MPSFYQRENCNGRKPKSWAWVVSGLLALLYAATGIMRIVRPISDFTGGVFGWPYDVPREFVGVMGAAELVGAIGLLLPVLVGILPWLSPLAALWLTLRQVLAIGGYIGRGQSDQAPINFVLLALSVFVLWSGRGLLGL